ncbi:MAG: hypothetical protein R3F14_35935, partial [Polyangiaceae bacterium]
MREGKLDRIASGALALLLVGRAIEPSRAHALEVTGGVQLGGVIIGSSPRFSVSPHVGASVTTEGGFLFALRDIASILPATDIHGAGIYNHTALAIGYAGNGVRVSAGPSLAIYSVAACGTLVNANGKRLCSRLSGFSPGLHAQIEYYFLGPLGLSASASVDWLT